MAQRKSSEYGKRYTREQKQAIMRAWRDEQAKVSPRSKAVFAAENHLSTITLDKWLSSVDAPMLVLPDEDLETMDHISTSTPACGPHIGNPDSAAEVIRAIKQHQASIEELKKRLRTWVDRL